MRQRWWFASLMLIGAVMLWQWGRTQMEASLLAERAKVRWTKVPKKVLAFYYGWYGNPKVSGRWVHWHEVDETNKRIGNSTHYPQLGPYDSHDPKVIEQHCHWAKEAGIDGFIVSWWQPNDFHDQGLPLLLDTAQRFGLEVTAYFETVPNNDRTKALSDVLYLLERYGKHPAWLKLDGKPVLFVYGRAIGQIGLNGWLWVIGEVHRRYEGGAVFIGDQISRRAARIFDGIHTYNITGATQGKSADEIFAWAQKTFPKWVATAGEGRIACLTIIPGYDDSKLPDRKPPRPITERHGGRTYRVLWEAALQANPDWVLITSWNEWHEGSEIEPSVEHGDRELRTTAEFAPKFKRLPPRTTAQRPSAISVAEREQLRKALERFSIALLPDADSEGAWWLLGLGAKAHWLSWEQIVDPQTFNPQKFPIAVYAGGEVYRATAKSEGDVLAALRRYVAEGGTLMVLPSEPMPFYYDGARERERTVNHAPKLGLPLSVAWERPKEGWRLSFVVRDKKALPHLPDRFPFPDEGDLRWRPLTKQAGVTPLVELVDEEGSSHGLGVGIVTVGKGRIVYAWFRLLDMPIGEVLLFDLWRLVVGL